MNTSQETALCTTSSREVEINRVLRNTYGLLALTLLFSAMTAGLSVVLNLPHPGLIITLVGYFGLLFAVSYFRNSVWGISLVFALTGFMGLTLGPMISSYLQLANGATLVTTALAITGLVFFGLSAYAVTSRRDFSFMGSFLAAGILVGFLVGLAAIFFDMSMVSLMVSAIFVLLMSGLILYETGQIIHGGETNYIMATVTLYVSILNLFTSLLHLTGFAQSEA